MTKRFRLLACALCPVVCALLTGCYSYSAPVLSVIKAEATEQTSDGCALLFTLDAWNKNEDPLPLRTVEYRVDLNGQEVFTGTRSAEATLRRLGSQQLHLPAVMPLNDRTRGLAQGVAKYRLSGSIYYVTPGRLAEFLFDAGLRTPSASFTFDGEVDLAAAQVTPTAQAAQP